MLQALKKQLPLPVRLCVAMDSWYFVKSLYLEIEKLEFDWVTKARKKTLLYRKVTIRGKERFIEIIPEVLFKEAKPIFTFWRKKKSVCMAFRDIYIKMELSSKNGYKKEITHGQLVNLLFHIRCEVHAKSKDSIQVYFDTTAKPFVTFFRDFGLRNYGWPGLAWIIIRIGA